MHLSFSILGHSIGISCDDSHLYRLIDANWSHYRAEGRTAGIYFAVSRGKGDSVTVTADSGESVSVADAAELLHYLESCIVVALQRGRSELYFVHAAVVEYHGQAHLLVAESGVGKSTITWGLLSHGFRYLSDELAPIDADEHHVHAYAHALCLKGDPPLSYPLPSTVVRTSRTMHVPICKEHLATDTSTYPVRAIWYLSYDAFCGEPQLRAISVAEGATRLYANGLNQLAHRDSGLKAAIAIAKSARNYLLTSADLRATCELVRATVVADLSAMER